MCGRYTLYNAPHLDKRYNLANKFVSKDNYNVAPRQRLPVIVEQDGKREAILMQWGFIPFFSKDPTKGFRPINTVSETAFEKNMWRTAVKTHRALIPARGFYEWKKLYDDKGKVERKVPYYIHPKSIDIFSFAGIYSIWNDAEGHPLFTFSIMTTAPNEEMKEIHDRMPVILRPEQETSWLEPANSEPEQLAKLLVPYEDHGLDMYEVSSDVNSPKNNDKHLAQAVGK